MALKVSEIQAQVKEQVFAQVMEQFAEVGEQFADYSVAVPVVVDGQECWAKVSVVCGQLKDSKSAKAFDPFVAAQAWQEDKAYKQALAESKAKAKADKAKAKASKSKAKVED